jgi:hypothetical protein
VTNWQFPEVIYHNETRSFTQRSIRGGGFSW